MLISIVGDVGSGKTLLATKFSISETRPVYSNYKINIPNYRKLTPEMLVAISEPSLIDIDEAYSWLESRLSGRDINLYLSYILFQSRKRGYDIILTDQLVGTIDLRFRLMTNWEIHAEKTDAGFLYRFYKLSRYKRYSPVTYLLPYESAEKIFPLYDSWELINPIDDNLVYKISTDKTDIMVEVDNHVKILLEKAKPKSYTKGIVEDYCVRNKLPHAYTALIYNAIKASGINIFPDK